MQVLKKPETEGKENSPKIAKKSIQPQPGQPLVGGGGWWVRGKETKAGFFAGRAAFVIVGAMLVVMTLISVFMLWVSLNEPYLQPSVVDETLHQNKVYLQFEGESFYHELAEGDQPANIVPEEVTQIPADKAFKIIFTPKQLDIPENYKIYLKETGKEPGDGLIRQAKLLKDTADGNIYSLTVTPANGTWAAGRYEIEMPDSGMFGGKWYAYFTVADK
jgi:hypothetical protein